MKKFDYDLIVIGGGSGGLTGATIARGLNKKVAIVEKSKIGGECTWTGCIPSKALIYAADVAYKAQHSAKVGLSTKEPLNINTDGVMAHVRAVVQRVYATETPEVLEKKGIATLIGQPIFIDTHSITINDQLITAQYFLISTGSRSFIPQLEGVENVTYLTNETIFDLNTLPSSMLILGGGAIGAEMASALNRLGVTVTIVEKGEHILSKEDDELALMLENHFLKEGITIRTGLKAVKVREEKNNLILSCIDSAGNSHQLSAASLLIAIGRKPNIEQLNLEQIGIHSTPSGITVNNRLQTSVKNIYACGDVIGSYQFTHAASYQARIAIRNMFVPLFKQSVNYTNMVWVTFTSPELAHAGLTEKEAVDKYGQNALKIYRSEYSTLDRARTDGQEFGMAKFICTPRGRLVGAHILGSRAGELIHEIQVVKNKNLDFATLAQSIHAYPTYSEIIWQGAIKRYIDKLKNNFFIRFLQKLIY